MKKLLPLFLLIIFISLTSEQVKANNDYYSSVTVKASGEGKVYVSDAETNAPAYDETATKTQSTNASSAPKHTYYLYAQANEGKTFLGWMDGNNILSEDAHTSVQITASESTASKTYTAKFGDEPYIKVRTEYGTVTINKVENKAGDNVTIEAKPNSNTQDLPNLAAVFSGWYDETGTLFSTEKKVQFTISDKHILTAKWYFENPLQAGGGYFRLANGLFNEYIKLSGAYSISINTTKPTSLDGLLDANYHPLWYYGGYRYQDGKTYLNPYSDPGMIFHISGDIVGNTADNYSAGATVMNNVIMSAQGEVATDYLTGIAAGTVMRIDWSATTEGQYRMVGVKSSNKLSLKRLWDQDNLAINIGEVNNDDFETFRFEPISEEYADSYWFGAFPDEATEMDGAYWTSMYTSFPYKCYEPDGVEAYYISSVSDYDGETLAVLTKIENGIVPPATAVLLKCPKVIDTSEYFKVTSNKFSGVTPEPANRLIPLEPSDELTALATEINTTNMLRGSYQISKDKNGGGKISFDGSTMRVLGEANGTVGFYKLASGTELLANKAYLYKEDGFGNAKVRIISEREAAGIDNIAVDMDEDSGSAAIYDLYGRRVTNTIPGNLYIRNGKKFIAR